MFGQHLRANSTDPGQTAPEEQSDQSLGSFVSSHPLIIEMESPILEGGQVLYKTCLTVWVFCGKGGILTCD